MDQAGAQHSQPPMDAETLAVMLPSMRPEFHRAVVNIAHILKEINGRLANREPVRFKLPENQIRPLRNSN